MQDAVKQCAARLRCVLQSAGRTPCPLEEPAIIIALKLCKSQYAKNWHHPCACSLSFIISRSINVLLSWTTSTIDCNTKGNTESILWRPVRFRLWALAAHTHS